MDIENPYASPLVRSRLSVAADIPAAWRHGDALLIRRDGGLLPRACIKTNHEGRLLNYSITTLTNRAALMVLALFLVPFVGLLLGCLLVVMLLRTQRAASTTVWLKPRIGARFWAYDLTTVLLVLSGNLSSGSGILDGRADLVAMGLLGALAGIALSAVPCPMFRLLKLQLMAPDLVCIRGAHVDYLDRLPPWRGDDAAMSAIPAPPNNDQIVVAG